MAYSTTACMVGGQGGNRFYFDGQNDGATLEKIGVWVGGWQVKAVRIWLTNGEVREFGNLGSDYKEFEFEPGEIFTSLSLWGNGAGTRLGAIKFETSRNRQFFVKMMEWELQTEYPMDVASGICLGVMGRAEVDIDCLGFIFMNAIESTIITNVEYPTLEDAIPQVTTEAIRCMIYENPSSVTQEYALETSKTITKTSSWSVCNRMEFTFDIQVDGKVPEILDTSPRFRWTLGSRRRYKLVSEMETQEQLSFMVQVPPGKIMDAAITIGHAKADFPYSGMVKIVCRNGSVHLFETSGTYRGLAYTKGTVVVKESLLVNAS